MIRLKQNKNKKTTERKKSHRFCFSFSDFTQLNSFTLHCFVHVQNASLASVESINVLRVILLRFREQTLSSFILRCRIPTISIFFNLIFIFLSTHSATFQNMLQMHSVIHQHIQQGTCVGRLNPFE